METRYRRPKGTRDIMLEEMERWRWCEDRWREVLERYGYGEIRTPIIESTDLFVRSVGSGTDIVDKEMYTFETKGQESITLRPEATASVVRAYLESGLTRQPGTLKFYYLGPMFRYDRPQAGRYRQFHQIGVEAIGSPSPILDAEVIRAAWALFEAVDADEIDLHVNTIGCADCRPAYVEGLRAWAREQTDDFCETCRIRTETNPLRLFDCKVETCRRLLATYPPINEAVCADCAAHHETLCSTLDDMSVSYRQDPALVRGLDYYTRTTFEISTHQDKQQNALCGGGRYDDLVEQCGGPATPAVGFSLGIDRVVRHLYADSVDLQRSRQAPVDVYMVCLGDAAQGYALTHADRLRGICRVEVDTSGRGVKAQMRSAHTRTAKLVIIAGDEEIAGECFQLKNLDSGHQQEVTNVRLLETVREVLDT